MKLPKEADEFELEFEDVDETERKLDFELVFKERETIVYLVKGLVTQREVCGGA